MLDQTWDPSAYARDGAFVCMHWRAECWTGVAVQPGERITGSRMRRWAVDCTFDGSEGVNVVGIDASATMVGRHQAWASPRSRPAPRKLPYS